MSIRRHEKLLLVVIKWKNILIIIINQYIEYQDYVVLLISDTLLTDLLMLLVYCYCGAQ